MNGNTDSRKLETELIFTLDVRVPEQSPRRLEVIDRVMAGLDPRNDLILVDRLVKTKHFLFRKRNNILTVHLMGPDGSTFLNGQPLEKGKLYILEKGDILKAGKIEIIIRRETGIPKKIVPLHKTEAPLTEENSEIENTEEVGEEPLEEEQPIFTQMEIPQRKSKSSKKGSIFDFSTVRLIPYKVYGFIVDVSLTYFILGFVIPSLGLMTFIQDLLYPITEFLNTVVLVNYPELTRLKILSLIEFFICFHTLMIIGSLILGTTPGAFLIGLHHKDNDKSILALRFKAYLYALINIVALPLLVFDVPVFKGKNLKELITFSSRDLTSSAFFKVSRRAGTPMMTLAFLLSPFFLRAPFTSSAAIEKIVIPKYKDVHTTTLSSSSMLFGLSLKSELNNQFKLLPYFQKNKLGMLLYDLSNNKSLIMAEDNRLSTNHALFKLRYANPLASLSIPNEQIDNEALKNKSLQSLTLSLLNITPGVSEFGLFLANGFLFKNDFLKNFEASDNFLVTAFDKKNPVIKISPTLAFAKEERLFLFTRNEVIEFTLSTPKQTKLLPNFTSGVLSGFRFDQSSRDKLKDPQILEVLESFEKGAHQTILTYYINEAKKAQELNDPKWRAFLKKNILQTKHALSGSLSFNIEKSFDDVINSL